MWEEWLALKINLTLGGVVDLENKLEILSEISVMIGNTKN